MVSRAELDSILKVQSEAFQYNITNVISIFETRVAKLESHLLHAERELATQKQLNASQNSEITELKEKLESMLSSGQGPLKDRVDDLEEWRRLKKKRFHNTQADSSSMVSNSNQCKSCEKNFTESTIFKHVSHNLSCKSRYSYDEIQAFINRRK